MLNNLDIDLTEDGTLFIEKSILQFLQREYSHKFGQSAQVNIEDDKDNDDNDDG